MSELTSLGATEIGCRLADGNVTSVDVTRAHLERIESIDPRLAAFVRLNPSAEGEAARADEMLAAGEGGPLTGVPIAIKDNLNTAGLETTCSSKILGGFVPTSDATCVSRLRRAGMVVLGKTNLDEFAMGSSTENSALHPTRNPWNTQRVPGGSSGGSAAAVAARLTPLALGSDTGGSIRQPAAFCGVVGLKPTYGRVSRSGLIAFGSSLDQAGPLARSVEDAAALLQIVAGADDDDSTCSIVPAGDYVAATRKEVRGLRIGLPAEYYEKGLDAEIESAVRSAASELEKQGATLVEVSLPHTRYAIPTYYLVATAEASSNLARYDTVRYGSRDQQADTLIGMYRANRRAGFGAEVRRRIMLGTYALSAGYYDQFYGRAQRARKLIRRDFVEVFGSGVDLLLTPPTPTAAFRLGEKLARPLDMYLSDVFTVTANLAGIPGLVVPCGLTQDGLPIGAQLLAPHFREEDLFRAGAVIENACGRLACPDV